MWLLNGTALIPPGMHGFTKVVVHAGTDEAEIVYVWFGIQQVRQPAIYPTTRGVAGCGRASLA
jgi:hypothetical protein